MSEEEINKELSTDELKDVAGGATFVKLDSFEKKGKKKIDKLILDDVQPPTINLGTNDGNLRH